MATQTFCSGLPITRNTALQNPLLNEDNGSNEQSATLRSWEYGLYIRDQFQLTRNLTVSAGVRWEHYPVPQHVDRGIEVFDFTTNRLMMCGLGSNPSIAASRCRRISSRHASASPIGPASPWCSGPATRAIRRTTT